MKHLERFGCKAFVHTPKQLRKKLDMRYKSGILVGYVLQTKGYKIWLPESRKVIETINVRFDESTPVKLDSNNHKFERVEAVLDPDYVTNNIILRTASYIDNNEIVLDEIYGESNESILVPPVGLGDDTFFPHVNSGRKSDVSQPNRNLIIIKLKIIVLKTN
ncbi:hypothetical protein AVEN_178782-1 [Araneus ventricosus]|uniref:Retroviral polymerase SH3-like domain-containing protein n=1 Tax=Araneus ventricosus TaxID=182803 RepID=A0A4Y2NB02_ARAVE|nr:hypothetical protein AVEN_178782-1 [Araneus ventricosus]